MKWISGQYTRLPEVNGGQEKNIWRMNYEKKSLMDIKTDVRILSSFPLVMEAAILFVMKLFKLNGRVNSPAQKLLLFGV